MRPTEVLIGLGGNLGDVETTLREAVRLLQNVPGFRVIARSGLYRTLPVGAADRLFLNAAVLIERSEPHAALLLTMKDIEASLGRRPADRWDNRAADLDILLAGGPVAEDGLRVPHALLHLRPFALVPALDVSPDAVHPQFGMSISDLASYWDRRPLRVRAPFSLRPREDATRVGPESPADITFRSGPVEDDAWPPEVDLRTIPISDRESAAEAILDGLLDRPVRVGDL